MKVLFVSHKNLCYFILLTFLTVLVAVLCYSWLMLASSKPAVNIFTASNTIRTYKTIIIDTDGDGRKDTITVNIDEPKKEYSIEIIGNNRKRFVLSPDMKSETLGTYIPWWPLQMTIADINMDKIPEIIIQISKSDDISPLYIFRWNGRNYQNILSGSFKGIFITDITGDGTPEIITEQEVTGVGSTLTAYTWIVNSYNKIDCRLDTSAYGYDKIKSVLKMMGTPFEEKLPPNKSLSLYFTESWLNDPGNREYLDNFSRDIVGIQLQDYISQEYNESDKKSPESSLWRLRYIVFRKYGTEVRAENYIAEIEVLKTGSLSQSYKIQNIKFKGQ